MIPDLARLFAPLATSPVERAVFAFLDSADGLIGARHSGPGSTRRLEIPFRAIAADALVFDAAQVVMAHNHPSGIAEFSCEDLAVTQRLARALDAIGVRLLDHVLLTGERMVSMRDRGLI